MTISKVVATRRIIYSDLTACCAITTFVAQDEADFNKCSDCNFTCS